MAEKYYPDFYLRKRQRDSLYRRRSWIIVGSALLLVVGGVIGYLGFKYVLEPWRKPAMTAGGLADEKRELEREQLLAEGSDAADDPVEIAGGQDGISGSGAQDLSDVEYGSSLASVRVEVEGSEGEASDDERELPVVEEGSQGLEGANGADTSGQTDGAPTPPEEREREDVFVPAESADPDSTPEPAQEEPQQPSEPPADDGADGNSDSGSAEDTGSGELVFKVYAGSYSSREDADNAKSELQNLGLKGEIIEMNFDYLVFVATLDSYEAAQAMQGKLADSGFTSAFATRKRL